MSSHLLNEAEAAGCAPHLAGRRTRPWPLARNAAALRCAPGPGRTGFAAEKQKLLLIPTASGDGIAGAALGLGADARPERTHFWTSAGLAGSPAAGPLPLRRHFQRGGRHAAHAGLGIRLVPIHALSQNRRRKCRRWWRPRAPISNTCGSPAKRSREARDLINTPANDLGPAELGEAVQRLALQHEAECRIIVGEDLLRQNYPLIYEVGKGSAREPRLIDMRWGKKRRAAGDAGGQGRLLRHRRPRHQTRQRHDPHEEGHGRRGAGAGAGAHAHGRGRSRAASPADSRRRELGVRPLVSARAMSCVRARASPSKSATPTPKAGWCSPTRWPKPIANSPRC